MRRRLRRGRSRARRDRRRKRDARRRRAGARPTFEPGHSKAVRRYYGTPHAHDESEPESEGIDLDTEAEYHQPPHPATGAIGDTITLTGNNLGVRMDVTVTAVEPGQAQRPRSASGSSTPASRCSSPSSTESFVVGADGRRARLAAGVKAPCSNGLEGFVRLDVGEERSRLPRVPASGSRPARLQLALEQVPAAAGGRWSLR